MLTPIQSYSMVAPEGAVLRMPGDRLTIVALKPRHGPQVDEDVGHPNLEIQCLPLRQALLPVRACCRVVALTKGYPSQPDLYHGEAPEISDLLEDREAFRVQRARRR